MSLHVGSKPNPVDYGCSCMQQEQEDRFVEGRQVDNILTYSAGLGCSRGLDVHEQVTLEANFEACRDEGDSSTGRGAYEGIVAVHKANKSGDLYRKIGWDEQSDEMRHKIHDDSDEESLGNMGGDRLEGEEWITSGGGRYVVRGHGSWVDGCAPGFSADLRDSDGPFSTSLRLLASRSREPEKETGHAGLARAFGFNKQRGGILLSPRGVTGFKDWYLKRTSLAKATSKTEAPPKSKYIRKLVLASWKHNGAGAATIFSLLCKLPLLSSPVVTLKALITVHKLLQQGPPECLVSCYAKLPLLKDVVDSWSSPNYKDQGGRFYSPLICAYASMLVGKTRFHHSFPAFENNYSVDFTRAPKSEDDASDPITVDALACLQNIQDDILHALDKGFVLLDEKHTKDIEESGNMLNGLVTGIDHSANGSLIKGGGASDPVGLIGAVLMPILREADLVYDISWYLISSLSSMASSVNDSLPTLAGASSVPELTLMAKKFQAQHVMLRRMFEQARYEPSIACSVAPPSLRMEPPEVCRSEGGIDDSSRIEAGDLEEARDTCVVESEPSDCGRKRGPFLPFDDDKIEARDELQEAQHVPELKVLQLSHAASSLQRQELNSGPIVGGVGAAAAAAMQRFAAGQAEAKKAAAASEYPLTPPGGWKNIRLEPPPENYGLGGGPGHFLGLERPVKPQHTRGSGRRWSSFDDEVFYHQHCTPSSPSPHYCKVSPKFLSPRIMREQTAAQHFGSPNAAGYGHPISPFRDGGESAVFSTEEPISKMDAIREQEGTSCSTRQRCCLFDGTSMADGKLTDMCTGKQEPTTHFGMHRRTGSATSPFRPLDSIPIGCMRNQQQSPQCFPTSLSKCSQPHQMQDVHGGDGFLAERLGQPPLIELEVPLIDVGTPLIELMGPAIEFDQPSLIDLDLGLTRATAAFPQLETPLIDMISSSMAVKESKAVETEEAFSRLCCEEHPQLADAFETNEDLLQNAPPSWQVGAASMCDLLAWKDDTKSEANSNISACKRKETIQTMTSVADWEISPSELKLGPKIGQGAFGDVLKGTWQGTDVAVKRLQNALVSNVLQAYEDFCHEVALVMRLRHPNIILFMGACTVPPEICIVMEYAANGSLYGVLHNPNISIDMATVVRWATEAARGMNYLHTRSPAVVHRDLKSVNLLVDEDWHIKVSDFGLAMTKQNSYAYTQVGTWGWMAPEVLDAAPYDEKADVYSFAVVLWELVTREEPFKGYHPMQIMRAIDRGDRPHVPDNCPLPYKQLIQRCWCRDPRLRPTFEQILEHLGCMTSF